MIDIFVPTYGKSTLPILSMLSDKDIRLNFCIRSDCDKSIYEKVEKMDRVNFIELGNGINNLGETRKRIVKYCIDNGIKYCAMFDDGLTCIETRGKPFTHEAIMFAMLSIEIKQLEYPVVGFCFNRKNDNFLGVEKYDTYFTGLPLQAVLLDIEMMKKYEVNYEDMDICGLEDVAFFMDCVKKGLVFIGDQQLNLIGKLPNVIVKGGSHEDTDVERFIKKRDDGHRKLMEYVGPTYGIMLTKKWRESLGFPLTYARIDFGYFREVLVNHRKENADIIKNKFRIE